MAKDKTTSGTVTKIKLDQTFEKKNGGEWEGHLLVIENDDGDTQKFKISLKSKAAKFVEKLKKGDKVDVKTGGEYGSVQAVFKQGQKFAKTNKQGSFDPTGQIQGNTMTGAIQMAIASGEPVTTEAIVAAAKVIVASRPAIDALVVQAIKDAAEADDSDDDDDEEDEAPKKKKRKSKSEDDDEDEDDDAPKKKKKKKSSDDDDDEDLY